MSTERAGDVIGATSREFAGGQKVFGRYTLVKVLGRGGMGIVWLARDEELERDVALKFLPDLMIQDHAAFDQLRRETRRCLELTHPHIVRIHDFIRDERSGCISMEYIDGETLSNLRAEKEQKVFEPNEIAPWISQLCDALDYAHNRRNVIHCDLKPANLMVNQRGNLKISDFGIARSLTESVSRLTQEQGRSGTLIYMSPQQLNGERCTHLDDIYSLSASIYESLTGKPPFYSGNIDRQICERVAPSMTERRKELDIEPAFVPAVWENAVAACLAKDPSRRPQSAAEVAQRLGLTAAQTRTRAAPGKRLNRKALLAGGIGALFLLLLAGLYFGIFNQHAKPVSQASAIPEKSIAVLPFENRSEEKTNAYFADGIQDEILTNLAKIADLRVISRTSVMQYKSDAERNLREIGRQLGVAHILEGSVQRSSNRVRVTAQLIDARTDTHQWAESYDRDLADVFAIQSEIAKAIADQLEAKLSPQEKARVEEIPTANTEAYAFYLRANQIARNPDTLLEDYKTAEQLYMQAIALDPDFALAHARLASVYAGIFHYYEPTDSWKTKARTEAETALRLQPNLAEAHFALGQYIYWIDQDYERALEQFDVASRLSPSNGEIPRFVAAIKRRQGKWQEALEAYERVAKIDPQNPNTARELMLTNTSMRRWPEAAHWVQRWRAMAPGSLVAKIQSGYIDFWWKGETQLLKSLVDQVPPDNDPDGVITAARWDVAMLRRDYSAAKKVLQAASVNEISYTTAGLTPKIFFDGCVHFVQNDNQNAQKAFEAARPAFEAALKEAPASAERHAILGWFYAFMGRKEDAIREGRRAVELKPESKDALDGPIMSAYLALIYARVGANDLAIPLIARLLKTPGAVDSADYSITVNDLKYRWEWDPLRSDPRFQKLISAP